MEEDVGRQPLQGVMVWRLQSWPCTSITQETRWEPRCSAATPTCAKREVLRGDCTLSKAVDAMLSPLQGGSPHLAKERPAQLQLM